MYIRDSPKPREHQGCHPKKPKPDPNGLYNRPLSHNTRPKLKVFCFFSSEKKTFPSKEKKQKTFNNVISQLPTAALEPAH
jgi:hypothetical protein